MMLLFYHTLMLVVYTCMENLYRLSGSRDFLKVQVVASARRLKPLNITELLS